MLCYLASPYHEVRSRPRARQGQGVVPVSCDARQHFARTGSAEDTETCHRVGAISCGESLHLIVDISQTRDATERGQVFFRSRLRPCIPGWEILHALQTALQRPHAPRAIIRAADPPRSPSGRPPQAARNGAAGTRSVCARRHRSRSPAPTGRRPQTLSATFLSVAARPRMCPSG
jgi:hypothetical protein